MQKAQAQGGVALPGGDKLSAEAADALFNQPEPDPDAHPAGPPSWLTG